MQPDHRRVTEIENSARVSVGLRVAPFQTADLDAISDLYTEVFSRPPFAWEEGESQRHREGLERLAADPTFSLAVAETDGELVGFAYGISVPPDDTRRWQGFITELPPEVSRERPGRTFAVVDLAVGRDWRGYGIGRKLLEVLLASRREERATLTVEPAAVETQAFYQHLGWQKVGRKRTSEGFFIPLFDVYVLPLTRQLKP